MPEEPSIEVNIVPRADVLTVLGVSRGEFDVALEAALAIYDTKTGDELTPIYELRILLDGKMHRLDDVANISISGDSEILREIGDAPDKA